MRSINTSRRRFLLISSSTVGVALLAACGQAQPQREGVDGAARIALSQAGIHEETPRGCNRLDVRSGELYG